MYLEVSGLIFLTIMSRMMLLASVSVLILLSSGAVMIFLADIFVVVNCCLRRACVFGCIFIFIEVLWT